MEDHPGLVVCHPTAVQAAVAFGRLEWCRVPLLGRTGWLHVVMRIQQHRRCPRRSLHLAVYRGVCPLDLEEANPGHSGVAHDIGDGFGATPHLGGIEIRSGDRWDSNQLLEFSARPGEAGVDGGCEIFMHGLGG